VHLLQTFGEPQPLRIQPFIASALAPAGCVAILLPIHVIFIAVLTCFAMIKAYDLRSGECLFCIYVAALAVSLPFFLARNGLALAV
jgi:hypothetical protein